MACRKALLLLLVNFVAEILYSQVYRVPLDMLTTLDDIDVHVVACTSHPAKPVRLPIAELTGQRFIRLFSTWDETEDPDVVVMIQTKASGDLLYIDRNTNNDLTDDGPPVLFPWGQDSIVFDLTSRSDAHQHVRLLLSRKMQYSKLFRELPDSSKVQFLDEQGILNPRFARIWFVPGEVTIGAPGTFYFDDRVTVRRGSFVVKGKAHAIGLFDWTNNGLYNDRGDVLLLDPRGEGLLSYNSPSVVALDDVFRIDGVNFRLRALDPYGTWVELEQTTARPTHHHAARLDSVALASAETLSIKGEVWNLVATTIDSNTVQLKSFRGKYLLLNFWGEWCGPCLREIPALVHAADTYADSTRIQVLSFLEAKDLPKARNIIRDSGVRWPQLFLDKKAREVFPVRAFPTNILVLPDGNKCIVTQTVSDAFFDMYVR
jgi:thiol-disulfide isomerase/thioredoxin